MASFALIISMIVLLAAYGYSIPVENKFETSTHLIPQSEFSTGKTIVDNKDIITAHLLGAQESASVPTVVIPREFLDKFGLSTPATPESHERDPREFPLVSEKFVPSTPLTPPVESLNLIPRVFVEKKFVDETTTFRPSTSAEEKFIPKRAFESKERLTDKSNSAEVFSTTPFPKRAFESKERLTDKSNSAEVFSTTSFPKRAFESKEHLTDKSNSAEVFSTTSFPKRAFESKERLTDKSNSAEVFLTTPVWTGESKEATSAERVNLRPVETSTKMLSGSKKYPVKSTSGEVDRSSEESKIRGPIKVTPRVPTKGKLPINN